MNWIDEKAQWFKRTLECNFFDASPKWFERSDRVTGYFKEELQEAHTKGVEEGRRERDEKDIKTLTELSIEIGNQEYVERAKRKLIQQGAQEALVKVEEWANRKEGVEYGMDTTYGDTMHPHPSVIYGRNEAKADLLHYLQQLKDNKQV